MKHSLEGYAMQNYQTFIVDRLEEPIAAHMTGDIPIVVFGKPGQGSDLMFGSDMPPAAQAAWLRRLATVAFELAGQVEVNAAKAGTLEATS